MTFPLAAGDEPTADQLNDIAIPGWTSYTPAWTAAVANPAIGNGSITGRYRRPAAADQVTVEIRVVMGSTTTFGTGFWIFSVPFNASATAVGMSVGNAYFADTGTLDRSGIARFNSASQLILDHPTLGVVTSAVPHAWANTDVIQIQIAYEPG